MVRSVPGGITYWAITSGSTTRVKIKPLDGFSKCNKDGLFLDKP